MFKKIITIVPVAAMLTVGATAHASTITVQKGDTLWDLARANNTSVEAIETVNHLSTDLIHPGDLLTITKEKQYTVNLGDTLWDIALNNDVTVSQIKEWNQLNSDLIHPGLNLLVYEGAKGNQTVMGDNTISAKPSEQKVASKEASVTTSGTVTNKSTSEVAAPKENTNVTKENTPEVAAPASNNEAAKTSAPETTAPTTAPTPAPKVNNESSQASESSSEATTNSTDNETVKENSPETTTSTSSSSSDSKVLTVQATAYTASCEGCTGITSTGINLKENPDAKVISVDPTVIPLGSKVYVEGYGEAVAGDTGGGIKGNKIDVFVPTQQEAINFGVKQLNVTILD
ncbi:MAG TPA: LysM peptidoglycan-binding domain-containing protein [Ureibacillus sp.]|nr:LysM peptidoglycan-binding domain-containing protein [Ureibacillus sp.]